MRTFDDIIPPSRRAGQGPLPPGPPPPRPLGRPRRSRFSSVMVLITVLVVALCAGALYYLSRAEIDITPTTTTLPVDTSLTAGSAGEVPYVLVKVVKVATSTVASTGTTQSSSLSSGTMTIYNTQAKPQKLITNTRFATPAGLIYHIHTAVTIPAGTSAAPGAVSATVYADKPGASYDIGASSFTVPGLAGTPEANAVYGRSTTPFTGGGAGLVPAVDAATAANAVTTLKNSLSGDLTAALKNGLQEGYILLPGAATTTYRALTPVAGSVTGKADLPVEATTVGVAFPASALAGAIASSSLQGAKVTLGEGTTLTLTPEGPFPASDGDSFSFVLSGSAVLVSVVDPMQIATAVAGKNREEAKTALTNYPEVNHAVLVLRPFWRSRFPVDPAAILISVGEPTAP